MIFPNPDNHGRSLEYDVAIYGAGPAGIALALALSGKNLRLGLFEAGGVDPPPMDGDHPYIGKSLGLPYDLSTTRLRFLGGTSNHWGGWCRPLDSSDFERHQHIPLSGWPISRNDLEPYLETALNLCEVPHGGLGVKAFEHDFGYHGFLHHAVGSLAVKNFLFSPPTRFGVRYRKELEDSQDIDCFLDSTLISLQHGENAIGSATLMSSEGTKILVSADTHVLAMGAIENARMMLHSGVARHNDNIGRCFADHVGKTIGVAVAEFDNRYLKHAIHHNGETFFVMPHLSFKPETLRKNELTNFGILLDRKGRTLPTTYGSAIGNQLQALNQGHPEEFRVLLRMENTPNPESRITLTNEMDGFGIPRIALDWRLNSLDIESMAKVCTLLGPLLGAAGARLRIDFNLDDARRRPGSYQSHHLGTTRMSTDPESGVVDADLRCHDVGNLYIAGSSVFPTFGFANPTLTLVALSLRLAEHLTNQMATTRA